MIILPYMIKNLVLDILYTHMNNIQIDIFINIGPIFFFKQPN
jgi:hypothetical protein